MQTIVNHALFVAALATIPSLQATPAMAADKPDAAKNPAKSELSIDRGRTAVLIMDYENQILGMLPEKTQVAILDNASAILKQARQAHLPVIYVVVRFREGYPEVSRQNKRFAGLKESGRLREGTPGAEIDARVAPQPGDIVVTKRRVGAFSTTDLESILRANNISTLAMFGISTSGVVLSTVRWAADMDYQLVVVSDACADMDDEVHRVLTEKVFPWQATVVSTHEFTKVLGAKLERSGK
ncbi:MAG: isochorismatase family cysteine hydrolase [Polyangia bacterium]|jgi:nicotinamidase-related amidase